MIDYLSKDKVFYLHTNNTSYIMMENEFGHLEHIYYGAKVGNVKDINDIRLKYEFELGSSTSYSKETKGYCLNYKLLELSTFGKGDYREPTLHIELPDGSRTLDFKYYKHEIITKMKIENMPSTLKDETLVITLKDDIFDIFVKLFYSVYEDEDIIVRNLEIINNTSEIITLDKALSFNLDMLNKDYVLSKLDGAWIRERHINDINLTKGTVRIDSKKGVSSSDHNPFFIIKNKNSMEDFGSAYGFALVYSGNFEANIETSPHDFLRVNIGVNSFDFRYPLEKNESFIGFLRLRDINYSHRVELSEKPCMIIRELKVLGRELSLGQRSKKDMQHKGYGKELISEAERICVEEFDKKTLFVLSGVGVKPYYRQLGFKDNGVYLNKSLKK